MSSSPLSPARPLGWGVLALAGLLLLSGCASDYVARTQSVRLAYQSGDYPRALKSLEPEEHSESMKDRLLVLLDKGMVLHAAGRWEESIAVLAKAEQLSESLDVTSVSEEAATLLSTERNRAYRGEDFEKLMITVLQALNYAQLGKDEDALVEVRRVNERLEKMIVDEKKPYQQLAIARYLGGALWEDQREWDSAYIDYAKAYELEPGLGPLVEPLLRLAKKTGRDDMYRELSEKFPDVQHPPLGRDEAQVVVIVEAGLSPQKQRASRNYGDGGDLIEVPVYRDRGSAPSVQVRVEGQSGQAIPVTSLAQVARIHLDHRIGSMIAKQLAGALVKVGVAAGVGVLTKSEGAAALTLLLLSAANSPDLRSWLSLPAEMQVARFRLPAGKHTVEVEAHGRVTQHEVDVQPGRVGFVVVRRY